MCAVNRRPKFQRIGNHISRVAPKRTLELPCHGWLPKIRNVQVQTHSRCNANCVFCPYIESEHAANHGRMTDHTWKLIIANLVPFAETINQGKFCPYLMQEPMIDKTIFDKIDDIYRAFPQTCVEVSTNGAALTPKAIDSLLASMDGRRHDIWVSHHGVNAKTFEHIMMIDYDKAVDNLIHLVRAAAGRFTIRIRGAGQSRDGIHTFFTPQEYKSYWREMAEKHCLDLKGIDIEAFTFHDRAGTLHREDRGANTMNVGIVREINPKHPFHCSRIDEWIHFMYDGTIRLCCMDYHGEVKLPNINQMSLIDYYFGRDYYELVEQVSGRVGCAPGHICTRCTSPGG